MVYFHKRKGLLFPALCSVLISLLLITFASFLSSIENVNFYTFNYAIGIDPTKDFISAISTFEWKKINWSWFVVYILPLLGSILGLFFKNSRFFNGLAFSFFAFSCFSLLFPCRDLMTLISNTFNSSISSYYKIASFVPGFGMISTMYNFMIVK